MSPILEIIIPVLNEEKILIDKKEYYQWLATQGNLIFVDGGSQDRTVVIAKEIAKVIQTAAGRAIQMNEAGKYATAEFLLFLHVDAFLTSQSFDRLYKAIKEGMSVGCFTLKIDDPIFVFRLFEFLVNIRAKYFRILDGDLGVIINRNEFVNVGGFDLVGLMEDILFSRKIKRTKNFLMLTEKIHVSSRVWHEQGFFKVLFVYSQRYLHFWKNEFLEIFGKKA